MKLKDKVRLHKIFYLLFKDKRFAYEMAMLLLLIAMRKASVNKIDDYCHRSIYWLKVCNVDMPETIAVKHGWDLINIVEKVLIKNKALALPVDKELATQICARIELAY